MLFIGNSYTFVNDLPATFRELAGSGGHQVETGMAAQGGWTLADHLNSPETLDQINSSKWDYVVLQEQSEIPAARNMRIQQMYPPARALAGEIRQTGAVPLFFITWAHRDGWPEGGLKDYASMQSQIDQGYLLIARELNAPDVPVGQAWSAVRAQHPEIDLWQQDGSHPTGQGTYLAACVFYAVIYQESPEGLTYRPDLTEETATTLQTIASRTVLGH